MTVESQIFNALKTLVSERVYPDVAPDQPVLPYITYQGVGGSAINFIDGDLPGKRNARIQVTIWASTRLEASALAEQAEDAMRTVTALQTTVLGAAVSDYEEETKLYGSRQDFSVWY